GHYSHKIAKMPCQTEVRRVSPQKHRQAKRNLRPCAPIFWFQGGTEYSPIADLWMGQVAEVRRARERFHRLLRATRFFFGRRQFCRQENVFHDPITIALSGGTFQLPARCLEQGLWPADRIATGASVYNRLASG